MKKILIATMLLMLFANACFAEVIDIKETAEYILGDGETKTAATEKVIAIARRRASERAGVYVKSVSKSDMGVLTEDEIEVLSASFMKDTKKPVVNTSLLSGGSILLTATVFITLDTKDVETYINDAKLDKAKEEEAAAFRKETDSKYKKLESNYEKLFEQLSEMQKQMEQLKTVKQQQSPAEQEKLSESKDSEDDTKYIKLQEDYKKLQIRLEEVQQQLINERSGKTQENAKEKTLDNREIQGQHLNDANKPDGSEPDNTVKKGNVTGTDGFVFKKGINPNTGKALLDNKSDWCAHYEYKYKVLHASNRGENHENATTGPHANQSCWNWIPVELGGLGNMHIRVSQDKKFFEIYAEDYPKTLLKIRIAKGVLNAK